MTADRQGYDTINVPDDEPTDQTPLTNTERPSRFSWRYLRSHIAYALCLLTAILLIVGLALAYFLPENNDSGVRHFANPPVKPGITEAAMQDGLAKCHTIQRPRKANIPLIDRTNPRVSINQKPVLIKHAEVWDGQGNILKDVDILLSNGVIKDVRRDIPGDPTFDVIDVGGRIVSPGLVDMHTHIGVSSWPALQGTADTNEVVSPVTPFVRSLDAFNPSDKAIRIVASGGITTVLVLPGSSNLMGGEAFAFKLRPMDTSSNDDMLVQHGIDEKVETKQRWMKMACGENPKRNYGGRNQMPSTRLGEAYLFRQLLADAQNLKHAQEDWCDAVQSTSQRLESHFPEDLRLESLVALLRGDVLLNIHCYETQDIEAMLRHANEFNFTIGSFHHALEAYRITDIIKRAPNNITVATFADHWGYKKEAYGGTPYGPKALWDAGIPIAFKSDHPVLNSQHIAFEAAKASHYGLPVQEAFKSITSVPADALGLGHRVGSLKVGYDADIVIWDRPPLDIGAAPLQVFVDGSPLFEKPSLTPDYVARNSEDVPNVATEPMPLQKSGSKNFVLTNVKRSFLGNTSITTMQNGPIQIVVKGGKIVCAEVVCDDVLSIAAEGSDSFDMIDTQGGYVIAGLIAVGSKIGMVEIPSEGSTGDGYYRASTSRDPNTIARALDGIKLGTKKLHEAYKGGVLTMVSAPLSSNVVIGVSAAFKTSADSLLTEGSVLSGSAALHFQIGHGVKSDSFPTISSQIAFIREVMKENKEKDNYYGQAARGDIPMIVNVNNKDEIAALIHLKQTSFPKARMAIQNGVEAHLVAKHLAEANIAVILRPTLCTPEEFESIHCLTGAPLTNGTAAHVLHAHGVKIGLGVSNDGWARNLAWDAGWLSATSPPSNKDMTISEEDAMQFVTTNLQDIFGLHSPVQDFVVWSGSPLQVQNRPVWAFSADTGLYEIDQL